MEQKKRQEQCSRRQNKNRPMISVFKEQKKTKARPDESVRGKQKRLTDAMRMRSGASASRPPRMNERDETKKKQTTETATESAPQNSSDRWQCVPPPLRRNVIRPRPWTAMATRVDHCQFKFAPFQFETEIYVKLKTFLLFLFFCCFFFLLPQAVEIDSVDKEAPEFLPGK